MKSDKQKSGSYKLKRELSVKHISMISLGGAIGTGLFQSVGSTIHDAGPGGAIAAYASIGIMVFFIMMGLGEMATYLPITGSFETYCSALYDSSFSFGIGWAYWLNWSVTIAAEMVGSELLMQYWFPKVPAVVWCAVFLTLIIVLNLMSARVYGETEYWFSFIKVATIIIFIIVGALMIVGCLGGKVIGLSNFTARKAPFVGGFRSTFIVFLTAGFAFQGEELLGLTAGESRDPENSIHKAVKSVFWRIMIFYVGAIFVVGAIIPYWNAGVNTSPFTYVFTKAGIPFAAAIMNLVILTAVLSAGNSGIYASSRMLLAMSREKRAPAFLSRVTKKGVPKNAILFTSVISALCLATAFAAPDTIYIWLINLASLSGFIAWLGIALCHFRFRRAYVAKGLPLKDLKFKCPLFPFGTILTIAICIVVIVGQCLLYFNGGKIDVGGLVSSYASLPLFLILFLGHKIKYKTKLVKFEDINFDDIRKFDISEKVPEPKK